MSPSQKIIELQRMTPSELRRELKMKQAESAQMRLAIEMQTMKNHALYCSMKPDIARMTMVLRQMEKAGVTTAKPETPKKESPAKASQTEKKSVQRSRSISKK